MHITFHILLIFATLTLNINCQGGGRGNSDKASGGGNGNILDVFIFIFDMVRLIADLINLICRIFSFIYKLIVSNNNKDIHVQTIQLDHNDEILIPTSRFHHKKENIEKDPSKLNNKKTSSHIIFFGFCTIVFILILAILQTDPNRKLPVSNETFINVADRASSKTKKQDLKDIFQSGQWTSCYFQYHRWHGPHKFLLSFNEKDLIVTGSGTDNIGTFTINGIYSLNTGRLGLTKKYESGTGNSFENLGHTVIIQLEWNFEKNQFDGKWYVDTKNYGDQDSFQLKFDESTTMTMINKRKIY